VKIQTDAFFAIGDSHKECQDYALTGTYDRLAYALVTDGCSSAKAVDFGARILAHSFETFVPLISGMTNNLERTVPEELGNAVILDAQRAIGLFPRVPRNALCATLLAIITNGRKVQVYMYGDGMVHVRYKSGKILAQWINYTSGAPYYLWYRLNDADKQAYKDHFTGDLTNCLIQGNVDEKGKLIDRLSHPHDTVGVLSFDIEHEKDDPIVSVGVSSDGIGSFEAQAPGEPYKPVAPWDMLPEFFCFRNFAGDFVQRRMQSMEKNRRKLGMTHHDDVSVAAIHFAP
jgi:hypothetical protein